jgi:hypothetical protein
MVLMTDKPYTVYGMVIARRSEDAVLKHYPDADRHRQLRAVVATKTKKAAAQALGVTIGEFNMYSSCTGNNLEVETALSKPGQVFARPLDERDGAFFEITRPAHVPIPRHKPVRAPYVMPESTPEFSAEEIEAIMDRFAMANDPIGQSIVAKAKAMLGRDGSI